MISPKLLLTLMVGSSFAAPQINERQVVGEVINQLQPAIIEALSGLNLGGSSSSASRFSSVSAPVVSNSRFSSSSVASAPAITSTRSRFTPSVSTRNSASSSASSVSSLTSSVVTSLQGPIADAVAAALAGSRRTSSQATGATGAAVEPDYGPAKYDFSYKVSDDESQAYIAQQETRDGLDVTGSYNFVDSTGSLVTVNYQAGPEGYSETRDVNKGAVSMRNIPVGWDGPLAGVDDVKEVSNVGVSTRTTSRTQNSGLSQSDLIAQILASIQPQISSAVSSAISASSRGTVRTGSVAQPVARRVLAPRPVPRRLAPVRQVASAGNNLAGLFGVQGENSVRIETPESTINY